VCKSARHFESFAVGQRKRGRVVMALILQAQALEDFQCVLPRLPNTDRAPQSADDDVVQHRESGKRLDELERPADSRGAYLVRAQSVDSFAHEADLAALRREHAGNHIEACSLASAVGPISATTRPDSTANEAFDTARSPRKLFETPFTSRRASATPRILVATLEPKRRATAGQIPFGRNTTEISRQTP